MCRKETLGRLKASQAIAIGVVGIDDISPSWAAQFFAYVDFNGTTSGLDFNSLTAMTNQVASQSIACDHFSSTGTYYESLIERGP